MKRIIIPSPVIEKKEAVVTEPVKKKRKKLSRKAARARGRRLKEQFERKIYYGLNTTK